MKKFVVLMVSIFICASCTRNVTSVSTLSLQTPLTGQSFTLPANRKACYGVSVRADDITGMPANTCSPAIGVVGGFVDAGQTLQVLVPKGSNRTVEVYLYLEDLNQNVPCPQMPAKFSGSQLTHTYFVGSTSGVTIEKETEVVNVSISFPGELQTLVAQNSYPSSCISNVATQNAAGFSVTSGAQVSSNGSITLNARAGTPTNHAVLTGGTITLKVQ